MNGMSETRKAIMARLGFAAGEKAAMGRAEDIYRKLSSGSVTYANAKEWERLAGEALRLPDFTPAGTDWSLHELAEEIGQEILAMKSRASRPGAKAAFAADAGAVAKEILRQLGGGRFMSMVGGKNAFHGNFGGKPGLQVDIGKGAEGGINRVIVTLDQATDTYNMEFWRIAKGGLSTKKVSEASGVYADDLQRVFTSRTKFYTSMSRPGAKVTHAQSIQAMWDGRQWKAVLPSGAAWYSTDGKRWTLKHGEPVSANDAKQYDIKLGTGFSRPGAKAEMAKWTVVMPSIPDAGTRHFDSWEQAKKYVDTKMGGFTALVSVDGKRYALKHALGQWEKFSRPGEKSTHAASSPVTWDNLFVGHLGNGWTIANKGVTVHGDYEKVANIAYGGSISWAPGFNKSRLDSRVKQYIEKLAAESAQKKSAGQPLAKSGSGQGLYAKDGSKSTHAADGFYGDSEAEAVRHMSAEATAEDIKLGDKIKMATDPAVGKKISKLMDEGYPQQQAIAIALDMKRRGEI